MNYLVISNCAFVKGKEHSIIYDFFRYNYDYIPNELYELLENKRVINFTELEKKHSSDYQVINEYKKFLIEKEYIIEIDDDEIDLFPKTNHFWDWQGHIQSAVIEFNNSFDYTKILNIIDELGCRFIQIRIGKISHIENIINTIETFRFKSFEIIIDSANEINDTLIHFLENTNKRVHLYIENTSEYQIELINNGKILCTKLINDIDSFRLKNPKHFFSLDIDLFNESQNHNPFYNRKIFISKNNIIKNSLLNEVSFLDLNKQEYSKEIILELIHKREFNWLWFVSKNQIEECTDCCYRHMCTDIRIPLKSEFNFHHKEKCKI